MGWDFSLSWWRHSLFLRNGRDGCDEEHVGVVALSFYPTGVFVFRSGLKNGSFATFAVTFCLTASIVISICNFVPGCACAVSTLARAIIFLSSGDHVVEVALPTCLPPK